MAGIELERVTKRFGDVVAVDDVSLDIGDGEFMVLVGPSGCGKSTALRLVAGLEEPDEGVIRLDGEVVNDVEAKHRDLAMVFQSYALYPHMTVRRNIAFPLKPLGVDRSERDRRAAAAAAVLALEDVLDRKPAQLSGGQRQRVALARAIVREPRAFLMDEPLSNLDAKLRTETRADLVALHERLATTFVYVTHDQVQAMTMADRVAILDAGRLQQVGTPDEVYERPANLFVAGFIGSPPMNVMSATATDDGAVTVVGAALESEAGTGLPAGRPVSVGVRPEALSFGPSGIPALVDTIESHGHERLVACTLADGSAAVVRLASRAPSPKPGDPVHLSARADDVLVFDPETGDRVR